MQGSQYLTRWFGKNLQRKKLANHDLKTLLIKPRARLFDTL